MALTKEQLTTLGVPENVCDAVIAASNADTKAHIDGEYVPKTKMDAVLEKNKALEEQVTERDTQLAKLGAFQGDNEKLKAEVERLTTENAEAKKQYEAASVENDKKLAIHNKLLVDGCVDPAEVCGKFDLAQVVLDKDGNLVGGYENQRDALKAQKAYYFSSEAAVGQPAEQKPTGTVPPGWVPVGTTPLAGSDEQQKSGPESEAERIVKRMLDSGANAQDVATKAQAHYFPATAAKPAAK